MEQIKDLDQATLLKEIGKRIAHLRISARVTQDELARKAGVSRFSLQRLEKGVGGIRVETFFSVLRALGVLDALSVVLPEPSLTPLQLADLEGKKVRLPKRVRTSRAKARPCWGDEYA